MQTILVTFKRSQDGFLMLAMTMFMFVPFFGTLVYYAEQTQSDFNDQGFWIVHYAA